MAKEKGDQRSPFLAYHFLVRKWACYYLNFFGAQVGMFLLEIVLLICHVNDLNLMYRLLMI